MAKQTLNGVLQHLRKVAAVHTNRELCDRELLERFVGARDEAAFTALIERHGPMVLGVCRRALPSYHDAEDACQATFLVLARKASSLRKDTSLSTWLHGVARRAAANLKRDHARRKTRERGFVPPMPKDPAAEVTWREVQVILDEELQQLPESHRGPLILCYLECMTRDEAARQLGVSSTTLHGRLERARELLRGRLTKRGLTLAAVMSAAAIGESVAQAALAPTFVVSSAKAALLFAGGQPLTESGIATHVLALTQEILKTMFVTKLKLGTAAVLCACLLAALIGGSFTSLVIAQDGNPTAPLQPLVTAPNSVKSDVQREPVNQPQPAESLRRVIDMVLKAHGGEAKLNKLTVFTLKVRVPQKKGAASTGEYFVQLPDKYRIEFGREGETAKDIHIILGGDGIQRWRKHADGTVTALRLGGLDYPRDYWLDQVNFFGPRAVLRLTDPQHKLAPLDEIMVGDRKAVGVSIAKAGSPALSLKMYFDKATGQLLKEVDVGQNSEVIYGDYKQIGGIQVAGTMTRSANGKATSRTERVEFRVLDKLDPDLFRKP